MLFVFSTTALAWLGSDGQYNYSVSGSGDADEPAVDFVDITVLTDATQLGISSSDDSTESLAGLLTAPLTFYNQTFNPADIYVSTNGVITFDPTGTYSFSNFCCSGDALPTFDPDATAMAVFWTDLNPSAGGSIWVHDDGDVVRVQYDQVPFFSNNGSNTAQAVFIRSTGEAKITVQDQTGMDAVSIGIQQNSTLGLQGYFGNTPMTTVTPPATFLFRPDDVDDDGDGYAGVDDCNDFDPLISPDAIEVCDGQDNDCNGLVDEAGTLGIWYIDDDADGFGDANGASIEDGCTPPAGYAQPGDCDDTDPSVRPNAIERCDAVDHDCDGDLYAGAVDPQPYQMDADGDGYGVPPTQWLCELPSDAATLGPGDCDDSNPAAFPGAEEIHFDGIDNNCDGREDDDRDDDGMNDSDEYFYGSDWRNPDTDGDGLLDGTEFAAGGDPLQTDSDSDGVPDAVEMPNTPIDTDQDGIADIADPDDDGDGHPTSVEGQVDTDSDGTPDYLDTDSDGDGILDIDETPADRLSFDENGPSEGKGCGCSSSPSPGGLAFLPLTILVARRR